MFKVADIDMVMSYHKLFGDGALGLKSGRRRFVHRL